MKKEVASRNKDQDFKEYYVSICGKYNTTIEKKLNRILLKHGLAPLFVEKDSAKLGQCLLDLIQKLKSPKSKADKDYIAICNVLLCYIGFLKEEYQENFDPSVSRDKTSDALSVAYYLSRFDRDAVKELGYKGFNAAFEGVGKILGQKWTTIKNMRDEFDPYFDNGRKGWYQRELTGSRKEIYDKYADYTFDSMSKVIREILTRYTNQDTIKSDKHKTIRISSNNMKEIKSRR